MKTFKQIRENKFMVKTKMGGVPVLMKSGPKGVELTIDGDLVGKDFKDRKEAESTAKEILSSLGKL